MICVLASSFLFNGRSASHSPSSLPSSQKQSSPQGSVLLALALFRQVTCRCVSPELRLRPSEQVSTVPHLTTYVRFRQSHRF